jgi:predicted metal-dependent enzyme (double-stranded beta helix superfamily)
MGIELRPGTETFIRRLDEAVRRSCLDSITEGVKSALEAGVHGELRLPDRFLVPAAGCYARRLLYKDPTFRYSVVVMVWACNQGTPVHDHDGTWCVECVYQGEIEVVSMNIVGDKKEEIVRFSEEQTVRAGIGEAGKLIPPFEYHVIRNRGDAPAVTVHVYGGELTSCNVFNPLGDGTYRRQRQESHYTP